MAIASETLSSAPLSPLCTDIAFSGTLLNVSQVLISHFSQINVATAVASHLKRILDLAVRLSWFHLSAFYFLSFLSSLALALILPRFFSL